jgi:hypothetical protein
MELLATGVRSAKTSEDYVQAALLARQKVAQVAVLRSTGGEAAGGEVGGGFRWVSEVHPLPQEEELPARLYQVRVRVTWPGRRGEKLLDLYTMRMAVDETKLVQTQAVQPAARGSRVGNVSGFSFEFRVWVSGVEATRPSRRFEGRVACPNPKPGIGTARRGG